MATAVAAPAQASRAGNGGQAWSGQASSGAVIDGTASGTVTGGAEWRQPERRQQAASAAPARSQVRVVVGLVTWQRATRLRQHCQLLAAAPRRSSTNGGSVTNSIGGRRLAAPRSAAGGNASITAHRGADPGTAVSAALHATGGRRRSQAGAGGNDDGDRQRRRRPYSNASGGDGSGHRRQWGTDVTACAANRWSTAVGGNAGPATLTAVSALGQSRF